MIDGFICFVCLSENLMFYLEIGSGFKSVSLCFLTVLKLDWNLYACMSMPVEQILKLELDVCLSVCLLNSFKARIDF